MTPVFIFSLSILSLVLFVSAAKPCVPSDYAATFSDCDGGKRIAVYTWNQPKTCVGGYDLPESFKQTNCGVLFLKNIQRMNFSWQTAQLGIIRQLGVLVWTNVGHCEPFFPHVLLFF